MSEYLVDKATNIIKSVHQFPMRFSISGRYVINIPTGLQVTPETSSVADLLTKKVNAYLSAHPTMQNVLNDELITAPNVDSSQSSRFMVGDQKRTAMFPGGSIVTNLLNFAAPVSNIFIHWHGYLLSCKPNLATNPGPDDLLHGFNLLTSTFQEFDATVFTVAIRNSTNTATLATLQMDSEQSVVLAPGNYRLRFTNNSLDKIYFLSDWLLLRN